MVYVVHSAVLDAACRNGETLINDGFGRLKAYRYSDLCNLIYASNDLRSNIVTTTNLFAPTSHFPLKRSRIRLKNSEEESHMKNNTNSGTKGHQTKLTSLNTIYSLDLSQSWGKTNSTS